MNIMEALVAIITVLVATSLAYVAVSAIDRVTTNNKNKEIEHRIEEAKAHENEYGSREH